VVPGPACIGDGDNGAVGCYQSRGGQLGDRFDQEDRRRNIITITAKGRAHLRRLDALVADAQDELLAPLSPGERQALVGMLTRLLDYHTG